MWPLKTILFFVGFVFACGLSLAYPIVGVANYIMIYLVNPSKMWWGKPLEPWDLRYSLTAGFCLILGMLISSNRVPRMRTILGGFEILLLAFTGIVVISGFTGLNRSEYTTMLVDKFVKMTIFMFCLTRLATTRRNYMVVLWALAMGSLVIGWDAYHASADEFFKGRLNFVGGPDFRESSGLAAHMASMVPLIGVLFIIVRPWYMKLPVLAAGVLCINTVVQCRTRSAFLGLLAGAAIAVVFAPRRRRIQMVLCLGVAAFGAVKLADAPFWERMRTVAQPSEFDDDRAISSRLALWNVSVQMFLDYPLGVGAGCFHEFVDEYDQWRIYRQFGNPARATHNSYLLCATELGIPGLVVFGSILGLSMFKIARSFRLAPLTSDPNCTRMLAYGCAVSLTVYLIAAIFTDRLYTESYWWVLTLPICLERCLIREIEEAEALEYEPELALDAELQLPPLAGGYAPGALG